MKTTYVIVDLQSEDKWASAAEGRMQSAVTVDSSPRLFALLVVDAGIRNDK
jgi:hypothetical protein